MQIMVFCIEVGYCRTLNKETYGPIKLIVTVTITVLQQQLLNSSGVPLASVTASAVCGEWFVASRHAGWAIICSCFNDECSPQQLYEMQQRSLLSLFGAAPKRSYG